MTYKKHFLHTALIVIIMMTALFMLGDASFDQVTEAIPSTTQTAAVADFNSSLVAHYTFDDQATDFNDPHATVMSAFYPVTVCAWATPALKGDGAYQYIIDQGSFHLSLFQDGTRLAFRFYNDSNAIATAYGAVLVGVRQHLCITITPERVANMYINNSLAAGPVTLGATNYQSATHIGYDGSGAFFNGYLEDVRIYSRALTSTEMSDLYADTMPAIVPPVIPAVTPPVVPPVIPPVVEQSPTPPTPSPTAETYHAPSGQLIPSERLVDWSVGSSVGVPGGIDQFLPGGNRARTHLIDVTQAPYNADKTGVVDASKAINAAIVASKSGDVIYIPSGTYKITSEITTAIGLDYRDNITIRGAGDCSTSAGCTVLKPTGKALTVGAGDGYNFFKFAAIIPSTDLKKGQTVIPFADTSKINVGDLFHISLSDNIDPNHLAISRNGKGRSRSQKFRVMAKTSNSITVFPPLHYDMPLSLSPRAASVPWVAEFVGVEDLKIDLANSTDGLPVSMKQAYGSWFKNVTITDAQDFHLRVYASIGCEIRGSQLLRRKSSSGPGGSGLIIEESQNCLIEDNIITKTASHIQMNSGDSGNVIAYNFLYDSRLAGVWGPSLKPNHGPYNSMNLFEGNVAADLQDDGYHGGGGSNTVFRNWFYGTMPRVGNENVFEAGRYILNLCRFARDYSVIGNVLGMQGVVNGSYALGWPNTGNSGWKGEVQPSKGIWWADWPAWLAGTYNKDDAGFQELDLDVAATTLLKNNYLVGQGIPSTEVLGSGESVPASLFRSSKPSYFGNLAWPPIGPETINSWSPTQGSLTSRAIIPAQARYYGLSVPGIVTPPPVIVSQNTPQTPLTPDVSTTTSLNIPTQLPIVPAQIPVTPSTVPITPAVPSLISRILPSFTSPTRTPTTPSSVTTRRTTPTGPFVPLPENTPEDISSTTPRTSIIATIKDIFSYVIERIWRGVERVIGINYVEAATVNVTSPTSLTTGLVGWWTMDGPNMLTNVRDSSGSGNNGTMSGFTSTSTAVVPGKVGQGLRFDGVNDYVNIPHVSSYSISGNPLTVSFWAKPSGAGGFLGKQSASYSFDGYTISVDTNGALVININGDSDTTRTSATTPLSFNKWHFIVVQITIHGSVLGYVDGVNVINSTDTSTVVSESNPIRIGISYQAGSSYINGSLDDVRIYNRALSATEVRQLYNTTVGSKQAASPNVTATSTCSTGLSCGLVGYWTFDGKDMPNGVARDLSGNGNNGNLLSIATSTFYAEGKIGQAGKFDGVDDYANVGNAFTDTGSFSASLWVKSDTTADMIFFEKANDNNYIGQVSGSYVADVVTTVPSATQPRSTNGVIEVGKWVHLVQVFNNSSQTLTLYKNGVGVAPTNTGSILRTASPFTSFIGKYKTGVFTDGSLDDVRIYNRALSATEVLQLYNTTVGSKQAASPNVTATSTCSTGLSCGLVGYWTFDGPNMLTNVRDSAGGNNGFMSGFTSTSTAVVPGKVGQGLKFDGVNDYVTIANSSVLKPSLPLTVSAWMRVPSYGTISAEIDGDNSTNYYGYSLGINALGLAYVQFGDGLGSGSQNRRTKAPSTTLSLNRWYHVVGVIRGATDMDVYIDGVDAGGIYSGTGGAMVYGSGPTDIGRHLPGGVTFYSKALYDDVRIYNRALSATEVRQLYNIGR